MRRSGAHNHPTTRPTKRHMARHLALPHPSSTLNDDVTNQSVRTAANRLLDTRPWKDAEGRVSNGAAPQSASAAVVCAA